MAERCKSCGRTEEQHKHSAKKGHKWVRIRCDGRYDLERELVKSGKD